MACGARSVDRSGLPPKRGCKFLVVAGTMREVWGLPGSSVVVWRVDCAYLTHVNWVYRPSKAGQAGGGRTHTFNVKDPSKVFAMPVFLHPKVAMDHGKPVPRP